MNWPLMVSTFVLIFVAELPDKTALAILLMATQKHPLALFLGAALAFLMQTSVALVFGRVLGLLPPFWVHAGSGVLFLASAVYLFISNREVAESAPSTRFNRNAFMHAFLVIFVAEWGDMTQLATASLTAQHAADSLAIFLAAVLALWSVTALVIFVGTQIKGKIKDATLQKLSALVFGGVGLYFLFIAF